MGSVGRKKKGAKRAQEDASVAAVTHVYTLEHALDPSDPNAWTPRGSLTTDVQRLSKRATVAIKDAPTLVGKELDMFNVCCCWSALWVLCCWCVCVCVASSYLCGVCWCVPHVLICCCGSLVQELLARDGLYRVRARLQGSSVPFIMTSTKAVRLLALPCGPPRLARDSPVCTVPCWCCPIPAGHSACSMLPTLWSSSSCTWTARGS